MLFEPGYEDVFIENDTFNPQTCHFVELWILSSGQQYGPKYGELAPSEVEDWVKRDPGFCAARGCVRPEQTIGGIRCLIGSAPSYLMSPLPLRPRAFQTLMTEFALPPRFLQSCKSRKFGTTSDGSRMRQDGITSWISRQWFSAMAVSYHSETRTVSAFVLTSEKQNVRMDFFQDFLKCKEHVMHPMLLPTLLATREVESIRKWEEEANGKLMELETRLGIDSEQREDGQFMEDAESSTRKLMKFINTATNNDAQHQRVLHHLKDSLPRMMKQLEPVLSEGRNKCSCVHGAGCEVGHAVQEWEDFAQQCHAELNVRIDCLAEETELLTTLNTCFLKKCEILLSGFQALATHKDAKWNKQVAKTTLRLGSASKRDSSSMKTIAVLTIIFLPSSLVAAILSMPMFEENLDNFWVFWAICLPLTGLVIGVWVLWMAWIDRWNELIDAHAETHGGDPGRIKIPFRRKFQSVWKFLTGQWKSDRKSLEDGLNAGNWHEETGNAEDGRHGNYHIE